MSSIVSSAEAFPLLNAERQRMDEALFQLEFDLRAVLRPAGFPISAPAAWRASSLDVFTKLNYKYRRLARTDIYRGGYQVRTTKSVVDVADGVAEHARSYTAVVTAVNSLAQSYNDNIAILPQLDKISFGGIIKTLQDGVQGYQEYLDDSRQRLDLYEPYFRVLGQSATRLTLHAAALNRPASPRQTVLAMLPPLGVLRQLQRERQNLEDQGAKLYAEMSLDFLERGEMLRDEYHRKFCRFAAVTAALKAQIEPQGVALVELQACIDVALSTPSVLPGLEPNTEVTIAALRTAADQFERVNEALNVMDEATTSLRIQARARRIVNNSSSWKFVVVRIIIPFVPITITCVFPFHINRGNSEYRPKAAPKARYLMPLSSHF
ncbi:hypothetical protein C8Q74DRAFT_1366153 [Fomes fomentarius]|nr:hypothetical protein C8Q74DRAFT_1366153 [Fomes fomentarius]